MNNIKQVLVTKEGLEKLNSELEYLKTKKRKEVIENIKVALSFGDLSENSEYDEAKNEQAKVEVRIAELEEILRNVKVIEDSDINTDVISIGSKVHVHNRNIDKTLIYSVVGSTEADPFAMKISGESPMGKALMGKKRGDVVEFNAPNGTMILEILEITK